MFRRWWKNRLCLPVTPWLTACSFITPSIARQKITGKKKENTGAKRLKDSRPPQRRCGDRGTSHVRQRFSGTEGPKNLRFHSRVGKSKLYSLSPRARAKGPRAKKQSGSG